jgi:hypothetical protein
MEWLRENWLLVGLLIMCPAIHLLFCARGHGHHGSHGDEKDVTKTKEKTDTSKLSANVTHKGDIA